MRIAHIAFMYGTKDVGGACIAATRLHRALISRGIESHYLCWESVESGVNVHVLPRRGVRRFFYYLLTRVTHYILAKALFGKPMPLNLFGVPDLERALKEINPDIVHLQWINEDFPSFHQIKTMPYPLVVNLHDLFTINAVEAYPCEDNRFIKGFSKDNSSRLERWLWNRKAKMLQGKRLVFLGPSNWIGRECKASIIGRNAEFAMIPNIIEQAYFRAGDGERKRNERFVIIFGAHGGRKNPLKGFAALEEALRIVPDAIKRRMELRIFGESAQDYEMDGIKVRFLGAVNETDTMVEHCCAADIFAFPSYQETQGMVKIEALACGTPVVAFDRTGCPEGIISGFNGWIAEDIPSFARAIETAYCLWKSGELHERRRRIAECAAKAFAESEIVNKYLGVCEHLAQGVDK